MKIPFFRVVCWIVSLLLVFSAAACSGSGTPQTNEPTNLPAAQTFNDPFAYCAAVGTLDKPDARYTGTAVPDAVINGFKKAAGLESSTEPMDMLRQTTIWRCMGGKLYACNFGANLPCDSKANTDKTPTSEMNEYCKANPGASFIPASVTGHETIYSWQCLNDQAAIQSQVDQVDAAGYMERIWFPIQPGP